MIINYDNLGNYKVPYDCKDGICLEVGANVGNFFTKYKDFFSLIHYYEPVEQTFLISKSKSDSLHNVFGFNEAAYSIDNQDVELVTHFNDESGSCSIKDGKNDWTSKVVSVVKSVSLETCISRLLSQSKKLMIDYLKIDCECGEYKFLMNKDLSKIKYIGMEIHCQVGDKVWYDLLSHIQKTHTIEGNTQFMANNNSEIFCKLKN